MNADRLTEMVLWTDGSASPNPGPGGWAVLDGNGNPVALGRAEESTNIKMEGAAIRAGLKYVISQGATGVIYTDSQFWVNVLTKWAPMWEKNHWVKKKGEIQNLELVKEVYNMYKGGGVRLEFVKGHRGTEKNELADQWANKARQGVTMEMVEKIRGSK